VGRPPVGEIHRVTTEETATLRDVRHRAEVRIAICYPAIADAVEHPLVGGFAPRSSLSASEGRGLGTCR
jgi:hypothetical protein